jgi:cytochrome d ubiquinol oxidase subunit II
MIYASACAVLLWLSLIAYAVLGGADFGAGIWDLFSLGTEHQTAKSELIRKAIGPVWETNNVWLVYVVVGLYTAFPLAAAILAIALLLSFSLVLLGIVLRGASFAFYEHFSEAPTVKRIWNILFGLFSLLTPFVLGCSAGAVASGKIRVLNGNTQPALILTWLTPFAIVTGFMGIAICATLAPVYLTVEAQRAKNAYLTAIFRRRAFLGGTFLALCSIADLILAPSSAPQVWRGMVNHGLWALAISFVLGVATAGTLFVRRYHLARLLVILGIAAILGTWGIAQWPYIVPPDLTIMNAASPALTLQQFFASALVGMLVLIPSLWFLFYIFKLKENSPPVHEQEVESD